MGGCDEEQLCKCFPPRPRLERVCELINSVRATTTKKKTSGPEISDSTHPPNNSLLNIIPEVKKK